MGKESTLKLTFDTNIKKSTADNIDALSNALERLDKLEFSNISKLSASLSSLSNVKISNNLGTSINGLVDTINKLSNLDGIGNIPQTTANALVDGFKKIADATQAFEGSTARIPSGTATIVNALKSLNGEAIVLDNNIAPTMEKGFSAIANAIKAFDSVSMKEVSIPKGVGSEISGLVNAIRLLDGLPDVSSSAENLNTGFSAIAKAVSNFEGVSARIPVTLGRGVTGLVEAINQIEKVRDISGVANTLNNNFAIISQAVNNFDQLNSINYAGVAKLVTALTSIGNVKTISNSVITNAEKLAQAINILDKNVTADTPRLQAMGSTVRALGNSFNQGSSGVNNFGNSLRLVNFASFISLARQAINVMQRLVSASVEAVNQYSSLENSALFFNQALAGGTQHVQDQVAMLTQLGVVDDRYANNIAILTQMYKGFGHEAGTASEMALALTNRMVELSFGVGDNANSLDEYYQKSQSIAAQQTRAGYSVGAVLTLSGVNEYLKNTDSNMESISSTTDMTSRSFAQLNTFLNATSAASGQVGAELLSVQSQMMIMNNQVGIMVQSIGKMLAPAFLQLAKYALIALKVVVMVIDAISRLFGGKGFSMINFSDMFEAATSDAGGLSNATNNTAKGMDKANKAAKELKKTISSIDQVFTIDDKVNDAAGALSGLSNGGIGGVGSFTAQDLLDATSIAGLEKMFDDIDKQAEKVFNTLKKWLPIVTAIGAALLAWKLAKSFISDIKLLDKLLGGIELALGGFLIWQGWKWLHDDDPTNDLEGVLLVAFGGLLATDGIRRLIGGKAGVIASRIFSIALGAYLIWEGYRMLTDESPENDLAGALAVMFGFLTVGFSVGKLVFGMAGGLLAASIGLAIAVTGLQILFPEQWGNAMEQISEWLNDTFNLDVTPEGVGKTINIATTVFFGLSTLFFILKKMGKLGGGASIASNISTTMTTATTATESISTGTSTLTTKMTGLVKNLALGLVIILEVVAAVAIIVGAIALLGLELQLVGKAWKPVIDNKDTILTGMIIGTAVLAAVGAITALLGNVGSSLVGFLGLGIAILALLLASTTVFLIAIGLIALELILVGMAWQPVIDNKDTILKGIGFGVLTLVAIGAVIALLGVAAGPIAATVGLGTLVLLLLGVAVGLFLIEIVAIGVLLQGVLYAWNPILDKGDALVQAILTGTAYLIAIGAGVALLGVATVAGGGTLPIAIGIGTAMLALLAVAFVEFVDSLILVSNSLTNGLSPALEELVPILPTLTSNMSDFADGMIDLATEFVRYSAAGAVGGLAATIDTIVGFFTKDPIRKLVDDVNVQSENFAELNQTLSEAVPNLQSATSYMNSYYTLIEEIKGIADNISAVGDFPSIGVDMETMATSLKKAFKTLGQIDTSSVSKIVSSLKQLDLSEFASIGINMSKALESGLNTYLFSFITLGSNVKASLTTATTGTGNEAANKIGLELTTTMNSYAFALGGFGNNLRTSMLAVTSGKGIEVGNKISADVVNAINNYAFNFVIATTRIANGLSFNSSSIGVNIALGIQNGLNSTKVNINPFILQLKTKMTKAFDIHSPSRWAESFVGNMLGLGVEEGVNDTNVDITPFENNMKNALESMTNMSMKPVEVPINASVDTTKINGDIETTTSKINTNVRGEYEYTSTETLNAINEQREETTYLLNELLTAVKNNSFMIDYKGVSRRVNEEIIRDRNIRNVRA